MNLKRKVLTAAIAALAAAAANAAIIDGTSGSSELIATVFDADGTHSSAAFDLGLTMDAFLPAAAAASTPGSTITFNLASNPDYASAWTQIKSAIGAGVTSFSVIALDTVNPRRFLTTTPNADTDVAQLNNLNLSNFAQMNGYLTANNSLGTNPTATNGAAFSTSQGIGLPTANFFDQNGHAWKQFATTFETLGTAGTALPFWFLATNTGSGNPATEAKYAGLWNLNAASGVLTYSVAAVPEPETWVMFLAGIIGVGAIARRRMNGAMPA